MYKKVPAPPPLGDIAPPKKDQPPGIITVQNSSTPPPPNFREEAHTIYHCLHPRKPEFEPFFGKITIYTFPVTFASS